jgi:hypothetical protein
MNERKRVWAPEVQNTDATPVVLELPKVKMSGHFTCELLNAKTGEVENTWDFDNLLLDSFIDAPAYDTTINSYLSYIVVGSGSVTGSSAPTGSDTILNSEINPGRTSDAAGFPATWAYFPNTGSLDGPYWEYKLTRQLPTTVGNGTITEIGWSNQSGYNTPIHVRSAILDDLGNPTSIVKTSENQLRVTYACRIYPPTEMVTGSLFLSGSTYTIRIIPLAIQSRWGFLNFGGPFVADSYGTGSIPTSSLGSISYGGSIGRPYTSRGLWSGSVWYNDLYKTGSYYFDWLFSFEPDQANFFNSSASGSGIAVLHWTTFGTNFGSINTTIYGAEFIPKIPKTDLQKFWFILRHSWGRK